MAKNIFSNLFLNFLKKNPDKELIIDEKTNKKFSWEDCYKLVQRLNIFLKKNNLKEGDTVVSALPNSIEKAHVFLTCMLFGYNFAPITENFSDDEILNWKKLTNPKILLLNSVSNNKELFSSLNTKMININSKFEWLDDNHRVSNFSERISKIFIMTSGTTGNPKAIVQNINNLVNNSKDFCSLHPFINEKSIFLNYLSMSYLGGLYNLLIIPITINSTVVLTSIFSGLTFLNIWKIIERFNINTLWFVPTIVRGLIRLHQRNASHIRKKVKKIKYAFLGTAAIDMKIKISFEKLFGIKLLENFGLSETLFISSETTESIKNRREFCCGKVLPKVETIEVINKKIGAKEIYVKSPHLFEGYLKKKNSINLDLNFQNFFNTGDVGFEKENFLYIKGRNKDIIKKGGFLVNINELEKVISNLPEVTEVSSIIINDEYYGENIVHFVTLENKQIRKNKKEMEILIYQKITSKLSKYKWPKQVVVLESIPKTISGKYSKSELEKIYLSS